MESFDKLRELKQLLDQGIIDEKEFQELKARILDGMYNEQEMKTDSHMNRVSSKTTTTTIPGEEITYNSGASTGMKVLSFLLPLVGLILFIVDRDKKPVAAKDELKWAGIGFGIGILLYIILL